MAYSICGSTSECTRKGVCSRQSGINVPDTYGTDAGKTPIPLDRAVLDSRHKKRHVLSRYAGRRGIKPESEWVSLKALFWAYATKPVPRRRKDGGGVRALMTGTHL